jgi:hypothetical protein
MKRCWDEQELIEHWTLFASEQPLLGNRTDLHEKPKNFLTEAEVERFLS